MVKTILHAVTICTFIVIAALPLSAQLKFTDPSRLTSKDYLEHQIKDISDHDLFQALLLDQPALTEVSRSVRSNEFERAFRAWGTVLGQQATTQVRNAERRFPA